jgi:N-acetylmannosamine-6-phosphate 2-epimerase / N-acetylmannosamine kinase
MQVKPEALSALERIAGGLIVSCQPVAGGPLDKPDVVVGFALAALRSGAKGLRVEGLDNLRAVRAATNAPIVGLIKRDLTTSAVRISPLIEDIKSLVEIGADIIAFDATKRLRPVNAEQLSNAVRSLGRIAMADISNFAEAKDAMQFGAHVIGTTMAGYTGGPEPDAPDFELLAAARRLRIPVIAEGCIRTPDQAQQAITLGAHAVVVGSAITRPEHITSWFKTSIDAGVLQQQMAELPVLGIDIGGTKTIVSIVNGKETAHSSETGTLRQGSAEAWCDAIAEKAENWRGQFGVVGAAVTGIIDQGRWSALNPGILPVPDGFPLEMQLSKRLGVAVHCFNDAQAAAWGEFCLGAGGGSDLVFLTISSGIGGGVVQGGRLVTGRGGIAGNVGNMRLRHEGKLVRIEDIASGFGLAARAKMLGHDADAKTVLAKAARGESWARELAEQSADHIAALLHNLQLMIDPPLFVIGGGVGLSDGFIDQLNARLAQWPAAQRPEIRPAALGKYAGVIGAADLARRNSSSMGG